ncbi:MAG: hypothetical protein DSZ32_07250 [Gammaproteobacteria bacterium]|nr:MAG: hypothetical protein DSZ32_07250 [Gammaproteobacteria bacterium]
MSPLIRAFGLSAIFHISIIVLLSIFLAGAQQNSFAPTPPLSISLSVFAEAPAEPVDPPPEAKPKPGPAPEQPKPAPDPLQKRKKPTKNKLAVKSRPNPAKTVRKTTRPRGLAPSARTRTNPTPLALQPGLWDSYKLALRAAIENHRSYPLQSRRRGEQGVVVVRFTVHRDGRINNLRIKKSSGYRRLDKAALNSVRSVGKFQAFPEGFVAASREMELPVRFHL